MKTSIKTGKMIINTVSYFFIIVMCIIVLVPIFWMLSTSLKSTTEVMSGAANWIPKSIDFSAYKRIWTDYPFPTYFKNSVIIVFFSTLISVVFAALAGYGVTRFKFRAKKGFLSFLLITQMFPSIMMLIPYFIIIKNLGLTDKHLGLIIVYTSFTVPFCTWMMKGFFESIPIEIDQAAMIDGCNAFQTFYKIILPLTIQGLAATAIYAMIQSWNEYMFALTLTQSELMKTVPVGIGQLNGFYKIVWNDMMAACMLASIPLIVFFIFFQKSFVASLTSGAVKQ